MDLQDLTAQSVGDVRQSVGVLAAAQPKGIVLNVEEFRFGRGSTGYQFGWDLFSDAGGGSEENHRIGWRRGIDFAGQNAKQQVGPSALPFQHAIRDSSQFQIAQTGRKPVPGLLAKIVVAKYFALLIQIHRNEPNRSRASLRQDRRERIEQESAVPGAQLQRIMVHR